MLPAGGQRGHNPADLLPHRLGVFMGDLDEGLGHTEEADHGNDVVHAGVQIQDVEGKAGGGRHGVHAHGAQKDPQRGGQQAPENGLGAQAARHHHAHDPQKQVVNGGEVQGELGDDRGEQGQHQDTDEGTNDGLGGGDAHGHAGVALFRQGIAVQGGGHSGRCAGDVQQDGRAGAAIHRAHEDADHQGQGRMGLPAEGKGHQQGDRHGGRQAGDGADVHAGKAAQGHKQDQDGFLNRNGQIA